MSRAGDAMGSVEAHVQWEMNYAPTDDRVKDLYQIHGVRVKRISNTCIPYYQMALDYIGLPGRSILYLYHGASRIALHELIHWTGNKHRADRRDFWGFVFRYKKAYAKEEVTAESGALLLCQLFGIDIPLEESIRYIAGFKSYITTKEFEDALNDAITAVKYLLKGTQYEYLLDETY